MTIFFWLLLPPLKNAGMSLEQMGQELQQIGTRIRANRTGRGIGPKLGRLRCEARLLTLALG